jgi:cystathionine beta-lyase
MKKQTRLIHAARGQTTHCRPVNPPVVRASTVLYPSIEEMRAVRQRRDAGERLFSYGARGTPTAFALEDALCELEGGERAFLYPTGLAAIAAVLLSFSKPGDHVAVVDTVYPPVRKICDEFLAARGVACGYYAPDTDGLKRVLRSDTKLIYAESPGSNTFEVLDLPAFASVARQANAVLAVDNTWSAGYFHQPLRLGADVSIQALTKYVAGCSDVMLGAAVASASAWQVLRHTSSTLGICASPDDAYTALRGLRSLAARLRQHEGAAGLVIQWLEGRPEVAQILYPAREDHPGHALWKRDFSGSSGLFSVGFKDASPGRIDRLANALTLFGIGASWGGYESLALPFDPGPVRTATRWTGTRPLLRIHVGLEDPDDLIRDLEAALDAVRSD